MRLTENSVCVRLEREEPRKGPAEFVVDTAALKGQILPYVFDCYDLPAWKAFEGELISAGETNLREISRADGPDSAETEDTPPIAPASLRSELKKMN